MVPSWSIATKASRPRTSTSTQVFMNKCVCPPASVLLGQGQNDEVVIPGREPRFRRTTDRREEVGNRWKHDRAGSGAK